MPEDVFDVVAEDPQEPHVAQHVHPAAVKKHGGEDIGEMKMVGDQAVGATKSFCEYGSSENSNRNTRMLITISKTVTTGLE